ncbi:MAG: DUF488 domain-containing protein [Alphaproteobacteria bacterium]|nr:DUF488 domain-containing protein [Alphaproteobacteria bacterium]
MTIFTIGHSNRSAETFIALLREAGADLVVDVRAAPGSRYNPQFNAGALRESLAAHGIDYRHLDALGGRRGATDGQSPNTFWTDGAFRNYADYAMTAPFRVGLAALDDLARNHNPAVMCAEKDWRRCHRQIIADYLVAQDREVRHLIEPGQSEAAGLNPAAERQPDGSLIYRPTADDLPLFR